MSLIARHFESKGLPTLILGSAFDILAAAMPPRAMFLNYPLGFEAGKPFDKQNQSEIIRAALKGFESFDSPGIKTMKQEWQAGWQMTQERANREKADNRSTRDTTPRYQKEEDRLLAESNGDNQL